MAVIGVRLEDKNEWERRAPLTPGDVRGLVDQHGLDVVVQSSRQRIYSDEDYRAAGAKVVESLDEAGVVLAIKEIPVDKLLPDRAYVCFAHVTKGQEHNMPLLRRLLELRATLIDYELVADEAGLRLLYFGREAGQAGMIDCLHALGRRLGWEGARTPFSEVRRAYEYEDLADAKRAVAEVGDRLRQGFEVDDAPVVVAFTGRGHVSRGAQEIFDLLPHEEVAPESLADVDGGNTVDRLLKVRLGKEHLAQPKDPGRPFDENEYRGHPERFRGGRLVRFLQHVTVLVHGVFWQESYPRFFTRQEAASMWMAGARKLRVIGDVTCDVGGSIGINTRTTAPGSPTYVYDPIRDVFRDGYEGPGIIVLAVDNLPCELPRDASRNFSRVLRNHVPALAVADYTRPLEELDLPPEIRRAVVTHRGRLAPDYQYLSEYLSEYLEAVEI